MYIVRNKERPCFCTKELMKKVTVAYYGMPFCKKGV